MKGESCPGMTNAYFTYFFIIAVRVFLHQFPLDREEGR